MLGWSINLFRIRGIQISLNWLFFLLLAWVCRDGWHDAGAQGVYWSGATLVAFFACILLHELGHSLVAMGFGVRVRRIVLTPLGGMAQFDSIPRKPSQELLITIAGPAVNFAIAALLWIFVDFPEGWENSLASFADLGRLLLVWNIRIALFNLIPAFPMDGGRILRALLATTMPYVRATFWAATLGKVVTVLGVALALYFNYYIVVFIGIFIFYAGDAEYRAVRMMELQEAQWREMAARHYAGPPPGEPPVLSG
jgi:Zn-dependent protease